MVFFLILVPPSKWCWVLCYPYFTGKEAKHGRGKAACTGTQDKWLRAVPGQIREYRSLGSSRPHQDGLKILAIIAGKKHPLTY